MHYDSSIYDSACFAWHPHNVQKLERRYLDGTDISGNGYYSWMFVGCFLPVAVSPCPGPCANEA